MANTIEIRNEKGDLLFAAATSWWSWGNTQTDMLEKDQMCCQIVYVPETMEPNQPVEMRIDVLEKQLLELRRNYAVGFRRQVEDG